MRVLLQRTTRATVRVDGTVIAAIGPGLTALVGVRRGDTVALARDLARRTQSLRILRGERAVADMQGSAVLVVSQFTLYGDTTRGRRPSWHAAAPREEAAPLIAAFAAQLRDDGVAVAAGLFGADMQLELVNDGPVTVLLER